MFLRDDETLIAKSQTMRDRKLTKETFPVAQSGGVDFKAIGARRGEVLFDGGKELLFNGQPGCFRHDERGEDKNRLR